MNRHPVLRRAALPAVTFILIVPPLAALIAIGWFGWRPGARPPVPPGQANDIAILGPSDGKKIKGSTVTMRFTVDGALAPADAVPADPADRLVHLHMILGEGQYDDPEHSSAKLFDVESGSLGHYSTLAGDEREITYEDIPPGDYTIRVEMLANDHNPPTPVSGDDVTFSVK